MSRVNELIIPAVVSEVNLSPAVPNPFTATVLIEPLKLADSRSEFAAAAGAV